MRKKINKGNIKHYYCDTFDTDILLIHCKYVDFLSLSKESLDKEWFDFLCKIAIDHDDTVKARQYPFPGGGSVIWTNENATIGTLIHEITHAVFHLLDRKGIRYCSDSEEIYAYLMESIFKNLTT